MKHIDLIQKMIIIETIAFKEQLLISKNNFSIEAHCWFNDEIAFSAIIISFIMNQKYSLDHIFYFCSRL